MIYLCKAFTLPCKCCEASCKAAGEACKESCKCIGTLCEKCGDFFGPITRGPLAAYVVGTWVTMVGCIFAFVMAYVKATEWIDSVPTAAEEIAKKYCEEATMFFIINIPVCVVDMLMARYIQWKVVREIRKEGHDTETISHQDIAEKARHIALYDIGFCLYVFFFLGGFGLQVWGLTQLEDCQGTGTGWAASGVKIVYHVLIWNYFFCWYVWQHCCGAKEKRKERMKPEVVGASA
jgi:hypothetical protein